MSATALVITIYYFVAGLGLLGAFATWWITRKGEDNIWRWIFSLIGSLVFVTVYWVSYLIGSYEAIPVILFFLAAIYAWLYIVFSARSSSTLDHFVFASFGTMVFGMTMIGGYTAGARGWWAMALPFYVVATYSCYSLLVPD